MNAAAFLLSEEDVYIFHLAEQIFRELFEINFFIFIFRKNKSFRPRDKGKKGLKNLQSVKTLAGRTQSYTATLCNKARKQPLTVSAQFQLSLHSLMETLNQANPFFIRCIKSNSDKVRCELVIRILS